jgi:DNA invertase Pin-like site-specific DNA recombinase
MDNKITLRFLRYRRKSSEDNKERQAASLEDQAYVLDGIEARHHIKALADLEESQSAHTPGRPVFDTMLERIEKGEANAILTWHPNRICRNMTDGGRIIDLMDRGLLLEILTPSRTFQNTPMDKFMLTLEFGISKKDSDDKSIAVKRGLDKKNRDGWRPGVAPEGYLNDKVTESGFRKILTDSERLPFVKRIFQMFHDGTPVIEIQRIADEDWHYRTRQKKRLGGKPLSLSMVYWILTNPFYTGKYEYPKGSSNWHEGRHETAVSEEIFNEIQIRLGRRSPYRINGKEFAFSAIMRCGICDSGIVAEQKWQVICKNCKLKFSLTKNNKDKCTSCGTLIADMDNPTILHYIYYRCGKKKNRLCLEKSVRVDRLEDQVLDKLGKIAIPDCCLEWAIEQIEKMGKQDNNFEKETTNATQRAFTECKQKLQNLLQLKIAPANSDGSLLNDEDYKTQKQILEQELKTLEEQLGGSAGKQQEADEKTGKAITFAIRAQREFRKGDSKKKREIFMGLGSHPKLQERIVSFDSPKYLFELEEMKKDIDEAFLRVAPSNQLDLAIQSGAFFSSIPTVLRG